MAFPRLAILQTSTSVGERTRGPRARTFSPSLYLNLRREILQDEPRLLRNLAKALREEGYAVDTAEDGLFKAETYNYDAIVLDVMLPRMDDRHGENVGS